MLSYDSQYVSALIGKYVKWTRLGEDQKADLIPILQPAYWKVDGGSAIAANRLGKVAAWKLGRPTDAVVFDDFDFSRGEAGLAVRSDIFVYASTDGKLKVYEIDKQVFVKAVNLSEHALEISFANASSYDEFHKDSYTTSSFKHDAEEKASKIRGPIEERVVSRVLSMILPLHPNIERFQVSRQINTMLTVEQEKLYTSDLNSGKKTQYTALAPIASAKLSRDGKIISTLNGNIISWCVVGDQNNCGSESIPTIKRPYFWHINEISAIAANTLGELVAWKLGRLALYFSNFAADEGESGFDITNDRYAYASATFDGRLDVNIVCFDQAKKMESYHVRYMPEEIAFDLFTRKLYVNNSNYRLQCGDELNDASNVVSIRTCTEENLAAQIIQKMVERRAFMA